MFGRKKKELIEKELAAANMPNIRTETINAIEEPPTPPQQGQQEFAGWKAEDFAMPNTYQANHLNLLYTSIMELQKVNEKLTELVEELKKCQ